MKNKENMYMWPSFWEKPCISGEYGGISSNSYYATQTGLEILKKGGNAFDAAVAMSIVLSVVEPHHSGIGGGCFTLGYSIKNKKTFALDGRGNAPKRANKNMFLKNGIVQNELKDLGGQSVLVPGLLKTMEILLNEYGTMPLDELIKPAIQYAKNGFYMGYTQAITMFDDSVERKINLSESFKELYLKNSKEKYKFGDFLKNENLAELLSEISKNGVDSFYKGIIASEIIENINKKGGCFTEKDMSEYLPKIRKVAVSTYREYDIHSFSPPSSGCTLIEMLNIIENRDIKEMGHNTSESIHILAEAMKLAFADRNNFLADPDFVKVEEKKIIDKDYAKERYELITQNAKEYNSGKKLDEGYSGNTSHFSIMDKYGNVVSQTQTIRDWYGSGIVIEKYGFVLNNGMSDFSAAPGMITSQGLAYGDLNCIEGGKIPLSSMSPTIVFKNKLPFMAIGAAGGPRIITGILQGIINAIDYGMLPEELVNMPFVNCLTREQGLELEYGISEDTIRLLEKKGHYIKRVPINSSMSTMLNSVMTKNNKFYAASTKRVDGSGGVLLQNGNIILEGIKQSSIIKI